MDVYFIGFSFVAVTLMYFLANAATMVWIADTIRPVCDCKSSKTSSQSEVYVCSRTNS